MFARAVLAVTGLRTPPVGSPSCSHGAAEFVGGPGSGHRGPLPARELERKREKPNTKHIPPSFSKPVADRREPLPGMPASLPSSGADYIQSHQCTAHWWATCVLDQMLNYQHFHICHTRLNFNALKLVSYNSGQTMCRNSQYNSLGSRFSNCQIATKAVASAHPF